MLTPQLYSQEQKRKIGDDLLAEVAKQTEAAIADFKRNLEVFALNHRQAIRSDPEFRSQFHAMCAHIGVDPLASNKSAVNKYLDFKDWSFASFYYELGVSVVEVCCKAILRGSIGQSGLRPDCIPMCDCNASQH